MATFLQADWPAMASKFPLGRPLCRQERGDLALAGGKPHGSCFLFLEEGGGGDGQN